MSERPDEYLTNRDPADERTWPVGPTPELLAEWRKAADDMARWTLVARGPTGSQRFYVLDQYDQECAELLWDSDWLWSHINSARTAVPALLAEVARRAEREAILMADIRRTAEYWQAALAAEVARLRAQVDFLECGIAGQGQILREVRAQVAALLPVARAAVKHAYRSGCQCRFCSVIDALPAEVRAELEATDG